MTGLGTLARRLLDGFWFVPGAVALAYAMLAFAMVAIDRAATDEDDQRIGFGGDADAAEGILSTIAGSLITVAGLAFSLTIVVLTLVSSQFTPRALPALLADRVNQVVAGSFVGLFAYCLLVLRTVRSETASATEFVPGLSVSVAIALSLVALALLLVFIHHMARSIQVSQIAWRISCETLEAIDRHHPDPYVPAQNVGGGDLVRNWRDEAIPRTIQPERPGYVQLVAADEVVDALESTTVRLHVPVRAGDFVTPSTTLVAVWPASTSESAIKALQRAIPIANERRVGDDPAYGIRQLADIVLKALSPGINDPTTAATCIGYLRACFELLAGRAIPLEIDDPPERGPVVVWGRRTFEEHVDEAFAELGRYAAENARIVVSLLDALEAVARACRAVGALERAGAIGRLSEAVAESALQAARADLDRSLIHEARERVREVCSGGVGGTLSS
ncbi:MAG TPA: DUF2254 domain-containing protein [Gaiellaceae bacterium]|nr:DUF2254 domain-containing protein [Gaiellaceae bacterium]